MVGAGEQRWTTIERLVLAHAVLKCGEGNWASVSRAVRSRLAGPLPPGSLSVPPSSPLASSTSSLSGSSESLGSLLSSSNQTRVSAHFTAKVSRWRPELVAREAGRSSLVLVCVRAALCVRVHEYGRRRVEEEAATEQQQQHAAQGVARSVRVCITSVSSARC